MKNETKLTGAGFLFKKGLGINCRFCSNARAVFLCLKCRVDDCLKNNLKILWQNT